MLWSLLSLSFLVTSVANDQRACDNNSNQVTGQETCQATVLCDSDDHDQCICVMNDYNNYCKIDLLGIYDISDISIHNRGANENNCMYASIYIGNSCEDNGTICDLSEEKNFTISCDRNAMHSVRYITVFSLETKCCLKIKREKKASPFELIRKKKTWQDALYHCRDRGKDLASILDNETQAWAELEAMKADTEFVWLGLHYTCTLGFWFWVEGHPLSFNRWATNEKKDQCDISVAMDRMQHRWFSKSVNKVFNFICARPD